MSVVGLILTPLLILGILLVFSTSTTDAEDDLLIHFHLKPRDGDLAEEEEAKEHGADKNGEKRRYAGGYGRNGEENRPYEGDRNGGHEDYIVAGAGEGEECNRLVDTWSTWTPCSVTCGGSRITLRGY